MSIIFLPNHETMIWYHDPKEEHTEGILTEMKGTYATHYFWRLWHVEGPGISFGYRLYPTDTEPVNMEITILELYMVGRGNPTFPAKGERTYQVLLFAKNAVKFQNMWLEKEPANQEHIEMMLKLLGGSKSK